MASPRLPFVWPLLKNVEATTPAIRSARAAVRMRAFHQQYHQRRPDAVQQRYGTANEPPPHLGGGKGLGPSTGKQANSEPRKALPKIGKDLQKDGETELETKSAEASKERVDEKDTPDKSEKEEAIAGEGATPGPILSDPALDAAESEVTERPPPPSPQMPSDRPLETILDAVPDAAKQTTSTPSGDRPWTSPFPSPEEESAAAAAFRELNEHQPPIKAPHLDAPRYVHHFDTYGLVRQLIDAGWSDHSAVNTMKAVRQMLAGNMAFAREALVSKSQVENETYLFRAACAELKTEVTGRRQAEQEKLRTQRTQLQHELDILSQRLGQESASLKDELKGLFDERKMAVRNEQRVMESKVQRLNYQITVELQADGKSEVEGLRWVMTRRVIIALAAVVVMVLGSLKLYSNAVREQELEAKRKSSGNGQRSTSAGPAPTDPAFHGEGGGADMLVKEGDNPAFVSLG